MKIQPARFQRAFLQKAANALPPEEAQAFATAPADQVSINGDSSELLNQRFAQAVLAVGTSAQLSGIPALAAMSQEIGQELLTAEDDKAHAEVIADQLSTLPRAESKELEESWEQVADLTDSPYGPPELVDSFFVYAQADTHGMYIGTTAMENELSNETVRIFTLAHEEAHRQNRDTAGAKGLETLVELTQSNDELFPITMKALQEGRHQNEREADLFAAEAVVELGHELQPVVDFLADQKKDLQHPAGSERVAYIKNNLDS